MVEHGAQVAVVVGKQPPADGVVYFSDPNPDVPTDSGFTILLSDPPHADDLADDIADDPRVATVCLHCVIEHYPEAGRGLDLAREHGEANRDPDTGEWYAEPPAD